MSQAFRHLCRSLLPALGSIIRSIGIGAVTAIDVIEEAGAQLRLKANRWRFRESSTAPHAKFRGCASPWPRSTSALFGKPSSELEGWNQSSSGAIVS